MSNELISGDLNQIVNFLAACGGLGTASYGLVDGFKAFGGGVSNFGFCYIRKSVEPLIVSNNNAGGKVFGSADVIATLRANWLNGMLNRPGFRGGCSV